MKKSTSGPDEKFTSSTSLVPRRHPLVGADRIIWASDYPHPDAKFPGVIDELREATETLSPATQAKIMGLNSAELYHLPAP